MCANVIYSFHRHGKKKNMYSIVSTLSGRAIVSRSVKIYCDEFNSKVPKFDLPNLSKAKKSVGIPLTLMINCTHCKHNPDHYLPTFGTTYIKPVIQ